MSWLVPPRDARLERMDRADTSGGELRGALRDIGLTNRWLGGRRALLRALRPHLLRFPRGARIDLLDVGTGGADLPLAMVDEARRLDRRLCVTAIDRCWTTARIAAEAVGHRPQVRLLCADARELPFAAGSFDVVTASLFLHHFPHDEIVRLLRRFRALARRVVLINDLRRNRIPWAFILTVSRLTARHPMYVHDAPLSVLRGFTAAELGRAAREAGIGEVRVRRRWPYRLLVELPAGNAR